ncbi:histidine kinase [Paraglaciecola hydrolytica]|uniref:Histidine kinase n=1 Tax=Paraglaciecola hydrolytica TaxID=1799789 RepID=A0A135ZYM7_9ALTE|nr:histidine kinase [Paraglaciecola hydrolytica]KXI28071.1 histidine kinase [Paraglaciecola hydrolytica]
MTDNIKDLAQLVHDARGPLNKISMNAELVKLVLENDLPKEKALQALQAIIKNCQDCSTHLQAITALGKASK